MLLQPHTWIVIANGARVRLLRNAGNATAVKLAEEAAPVLDDPDVGPSGSQPQDANLAETAFNRRLALWLNQQALNQRFEHLVLVADPASMGELRPQLHPQVSARTRAEITKDWTRLGIQDIAQALAQVEP